MCVLLFRVYISANNLLDLSNCIDVMAFHAFWYEASTVGHRYSMHNFYMGIPTIESCIAINPLEPNGNFSYRIEQCYSYESTI